MNVRYAIFNLDVLTAISFDEQRTGDIMALQRQISQVVKFPLSVAFIVLKKRPAENWKVRPRNTEETGTSV